MSILQYIGGQTKNIPGAMFGAGRGQWGTLDYGIHYFLINRKIKCNTFLYKLSKVHGVTQSVRQTNYGAEELCTLYLFNFSFVILSFLSSPPTTLKINLSGNLISFDIL